MLDGRFRIKAFHRFIFPKHVLHLECVSHRLNAANVDLIQLFEIVEDSPKLLGKLFALVIRQIDACKIGHIINIDGIVVTHLKNEPRKRLKIRFPLARY